jgi:aarF domain-containing kinase
MSFEEMPIAAASIGQVHQATLANAGDVVVKVQYPGIEDSIEADLGYLRTLLVVSSFLPKGLFLENSLRVLSRELHEECDYEQEAQACQRFGKLLKGDKYLRVPAVYSELSTKRVLVMERMQGVALPKILPQLSQSTRNHVWRELSKAFEPWLNFHTDWRTDLAALLDGALPVSLHADRP